MLKVLLEGVCQRAAEDIGGGLDSTKVGVEVDKDIPLTRAELPEESHSIREEALLIEDGAGPQTEIFLNRMAEIRGVIVVAEANPEIHPEISVPVGV